MSFLGMFKLTRWTKLIRIIFKLNQSGKKYLFENLNQFDKKSKLSEYSIKGKIN